MDIAAFILTALLCYFISGIVHELGHIVVGLTNGWKFLFLVVGPLGIKADKNGKIVFYFEKRAIMWGGVGAALPQRVDEKNIKIWSKVLLGGPLASIIMGIVFLPFGIATKNIMLLFLGAMPFAMGIACILPFPIKTGILYSDGARLARLHKGGQEADEETALFKLTENQAAGGSIKDIDLNSIHSLVKSKDAAIRYYGYYYEYQYYKAVYDNENMNLAVQKMNIIKDKVPSIIVNDCKVE